MNSLDQFQLDRNFKIIKRLIDQLQLDLTGIKILTEAGSNLFLYTPIIAALANAEKVFVWTKDSDYGSAKSIADQCQAIAVAFNLEIKLEIAINEQPISHLSSSNVITNSGNLRPLDQSKLKYISKNAVIPLMYEKWEFRNSDLDLEFCKSKGIKVAGTWENYPGLEIFNYCEQLIIKLIFDAGFEIKSNKVVIFSSDHFGDLAEKGLTLLGATVVKTIDIDSVYKNIVDSDILLFCNYLDQRCLIGNDNSVFSIGKLKSLNDTLCIVHLTGNIDSDLVKRNGVYLYPNKRGYSQKMTETLNFLGSVPALSLLAAGLKVGECLYKKVEHPIVQFLSK